MTDNDMDASEFIKKACEEVRKAKKEHPSDREARELIIKARSGNKAALNALIDRNQGLVMSIARKYAQDDEFFKDLVQEGSLGLMRAIEKYDLDGETKLSTYAGIWIRSNIESYISKTSYAVKVTQTQRKLSFKVSRMYNRLIGSGLSNSEALASVSRNLDIPEMALSKLIALKNSAVSMQNQKGGGFEDDGVEIQDTIASGASTDSTLEEESVKKQVNMRVQELPQKQREAVSLYYGLGSYPEKSTFSGVGQHMNITREYARILFNQGMKALMQKASSFEELAA